MSNGDLLQSDHDLPPEAFSLIIGPNKHLGDFGPMRSVLLAGKLDLACGDDALSGKRTDEPEIWLDNLVPVGTSLGLGWRTDPAHRCSGTDYVIKNGDEIAYLGFRQDGHRADVSRGGQQ